MEPGGAPSELSFHQQVSVQASIIVPQTKGRNSPAFAVLLTRTSRSSALRDRFSKQRAEFTAG
jgi:hypothetical protein